MLVLAFVSGWLLLSIYWFNYKHLLKRLLLGGVPWMMNMRPFPLSHLEMNIHSSRVWVERRSSIVVDNSGIDVKLFPFRIVAASHEPPTFER